MNPFARFELPLAFDLNETQLKATFLKQQKRLHPDNFTQSDTQTQRQMMQLSSQLNDDFLRLKDPILRAETLLYLLAPEMMEQKSQQDLDFLMQQMTWREALEDIESNEDLDALDELTDEVKKAFNDHLTDLTTALNNQNYTEAKDRTEKLRFLQKLQAELQRIDDKLSDF